MLKEKNKVFVFRDYDSTKSIWSLLDDLHRSLKMKPSFAQFLTLSAAERSWNLRSKKFVRFVYCTPYVALSESRRYKRPTDQSAQRLVFGLPTALFAIKQLRFSILDHRYERRPLDKSSARWLTKWERLFSFLPTNDHSSSASKHKIWKSASSGIWKFRSSGTCRERQPMKFISQHKLMSRTRQIPRREMSSSNNRQINCRRWSSTVACRMRNCLPQLKHRWFCLP